MPAPGSTLGLSVRRRLSITDEQPYNFYPPCRCSSSRAKSARELCSSSTNSSSSSSTTSSTAIWYVCYADAIRIPPFPLHKELNRVLKLTPVCPSSLAQPVRHGPTTFLLLGRGRLPAPNDTAMASAAANRHWLSAAIRGSRRQYRNDVLLPQLSAKCHNGRISR